MTAYLCSHSAFSCCVVMRFVCLQVYFASIDYSQHYGLQRTQLVRLSLMIDEALYALR